MQKKMSFILYSDCFTHLQHARPLERAKFYFFFLKKLSSTLQAVPLALAQVSLQKRHM